MGVAVKICGLTSAAAVTAAVEGGAAYLGFVFYPPSPRALSPERAAGLCAGIGGAAARVGLFVDADDEAIAVVLARVPLDLLQFHGRESPERVAAARARFGRPIIKAVAVAGGADLAVATAYEDAADLLLFDAKPPPRRGALPGGHGRAFDWALLAGRGRGVGRGDRRCRLGGRSAARLQGTRQDPRIPRRGAHPLRRRIAGHAPPPRPGAVAQATRTAPRA